MNSQPHPEQHHRCPQCHEPVRPDSAFCGNCGASLAGVTAGNEVGDSSDEQMTATFVPVSSSAGDAEYKPVSEPSPWAPPDSDHYIPPTRFDQPAPAAGEPNATMLASRPDFVDDTPRRAGPQGVRGLFLGTLAMILIGAVFSLYLYDAWLSDSARATVESWLPWLE